MGAPLLRMLFGASMVAVAAWIVATPATAVSSSCDGMTNWEKGWLFTDKKHSGTEVPNGYQAHSSVSVQSEYYHTYLDGGFSEHPTCTGS